MFVLDLQDKKIKVKFYHEKTPDDKKHSHITHCIVTIEGDNMLRQVLEYASCARGDNFSRDTGRRISLTRALSFPLFSKEERKLIWSKYFDMVKKRPNIKIN